VSTTDLAIILGRHVFSSVDLSRRGIKHCLNSEHTPQDMPPLRAWPLSASSWGGATEQSLTRPLQTWICSAYEALQPMLMRAPFPCRSRSRASGAVAIHGQEPWRCFTANRTAATVPSMLRSGDQVSIRLRAAMPSVRSRSRSPSNRSRRSARAGTFPQG
jgi:hypothetical protein